jgi:hypothetical protein
MKYTVEMASGAIILRFIKIGSGIQRLLGGYIHVDTDRQTDRKLIS